MIERSLQGSMLWASYSCLSKYVDYLVLRTDSFCPHFYDIWIGEISHADGKSYWALTSCSVEESLINLHS